jgi:hypothetical protein
MRSWAANGAVPTGSQVGARLGTASKALRSCRMPEPRLIRTNALAWSGVETSLRRRRCRSTANSLPSAPTSSTTRATMRAFSTSSHRRVRCEPDFRLPFATGTDPLVRVPASDCGAQRPTSLGIERAQRRRTFVDRLGVRPGGCVRLPILPGRPISRSLLLIGEGPTLFGDQAKSPTAARFVDDSRWREQDSNPRSPGCGLGASGRARRDPRRQREVGKEHAIEQGKILRACQREHVVARSKRRGRRSAASDPESPPERSPWAGAAARFHSIACHRVLVAEPAGEIDVQTGGLLERRRVQIEHPRGRRDRPTLEDQRYQNYNERIWA